MCGSKDVNGGRLFLFHHFSSMTNFKNKIFAQLEAIFSQSFFLINICVIKNYMSPFSMISLQKQILKWSILKFLECFSKNVTYQQILTWAVWMTLQMKSSTIFDWMSELVLKFDWKKWEKLWFQKIIPGFFIQYQTSVIFLNLLLPLVVAPWKNLNVNSVEISRLFVF